MSQDLAKLHEEFMAECRYAARLSDETLRGYEASFRLFAHLMPGVDLTTLNSQSMTAFFRKLETRERIVGKGRIKKGIRPSTAATYRSKLNKYFDWLERKGHLEENPFKNMPYPAVVYEDRKYLKKRDIERIMTSVGFTIDWRSELIRKRNVAILQTFLCCGLRRSELLHLQMHDVELQRKFLFVRGVTSKSRRQRTVPLNSQALTAIKDYVSERKMRQYTTPWLWVSNQSDRGLGSSGLNRLVARTASVSGVRFHVHQFRHTFAVNLLNNGCDVAKLKQLLGHSDIRMTLTYLRCLPTKAMRADVETLTFDNLL